MPVVYGSSSNLLSIRKRNLKINLLPRKHCKYLHCSPVLFSLQKGILWNHRGIESPSLTLFSPPPSPPAPPPRSQIVAFKQWPFFSGGHLLFWVGFPCRLFWVSSRAALRRGRCRRSRRGDHPVLITQPSTKPGRSQLAVCNHGKSRPLVAFPIFIRMGQKTISCS